MAKKVKNNTKPKSNITSPTPNIINKISFDFSEEKWLETVEYRKFTNKMSSVESYAKHMTLIFYKLIPYVIKNWDWIKVHSYRGMGHHCHLVSEDKLDLVKEISTIIHGDLDILDDDRNLWQLGIEDSTRLIVYHLESQNAFIPLFVDYNHLIHPVRDDRRKQVRFNDVSTNSYCPVSTFLGVR